MTRTVSGTERALQASKEANLHHLKVLGDALSHHFHQQELCRREIAVLKITDIDTVLTYSKVQVNLRLWRKIVNRDGQDGGRRQTFPVRSGLCF